MKRELKVFQVIGIVLLVALITAVSCGKKAGNNNSGNGGNNGGGDAGNSSASNGNSGGNNANNGNNGGSGVVSCSDSTATPAIAITNVLASSVDELGYTVTNPIKVEGTNISIKISPFYFANEGDSTNFDDVLTEVDPNLNDTNVLRRKAFDFVLTESCGGLVMVAPGNVASVGDFTAPALATGVPADNGGNEGVFLVTGATESGFVAKGLNIYGVFMNSDARATYAFGSGLVEIIPTNEYNKPTFYCRAVVPEITTTTPAVTATLKGGEKTECFISSQGHSYPNTRWLNASPRKEIEIAVGAVRTDEKKLSEIGISASEFADGLSTADMAKLAGANKTDYKKYKITIVGNYAF